jgi:hypothetical protein
MRNFLYRCSGAAIIALLANSAPAADLLTTLQAEAPPPAQDFIVESNNQIIAEFVEAHLDYSEYAGAYGTLPGLLDTEKGWVPGFGAKLSVMNSAFVNNAYFEAEFTRSQSRTAYEGGVIGGCGYGCVLKDDEAIFTDFHNRYGQGFEVQPDFMITPYVEWGYHRWNRAVNAGETYDNYYVGAGGMAQYSPLSRLVLSANAMIGATVGSWIDVNAITGFAPAWSDKLGNSLTYDIGGSADYGVTRSLHVTAGLDYAYFKYGASPLQPSGFFEPRSATGMTTAKLGLGYAF